MKTFLSLLALLMMEMAGNAQTLKAVSAYDVNQDDKETVSDATTVVDHLKSASATDKTVVDTEALLKVLASLDSRLKAIEEKLGITPTDPTDPEDTHKYVDLGLPSGTLWATCNVGAESPEDYGLYFAWGETTGYTSDTSDGHLFMWEHYKWCNGAASTMTKYSTSTEYWDSSLGTSPDQKTELDPEDDAATANWGSAWCMPTDAQLTELRTNCTWTWTTQNGVNGRKGTGTNGNSIFLPAAGDRYDNWFNADGSIGYYWSRSLYSSYPEDALYMGFDSSHVFRANNVRYTAYPVRAVRSVAN